MSLGQILIPSDSQGEDLMGSTSIFSNDDGDTTTNW